MPLWTTTDVFAPGIALGHVVGRLGCLLAGCCFGTPDDGAVGDHVPRSAACAVAGTPLGVPLHPTQLYEAGAEALILGVPARDRTQRPAVSGRTFWSYMLLYGDLAVRHRVLSRRQPRAWCSTRCPTSQFVSVILVPLSIVDARRCSAGARIRRGTAAAQRVGRVKRCTRRG